MMRGTDRRRSGKPKPSAIADARVKARVRGVRVKVEAPLNGGPDKLVRVAEHTRGQAGVLKAIEEARHNVVPKYSKLLVRLKRGCLDALQLPRQIENGGLRGARRSEEIPEVTKSLKSISHWNENTVNAEVRLSPRNTDAAGSSDRDGGGLLGVQGHSSGPEEVGYRGPGGGQMYIVVLEEEEIVHESEDGDFFLPHGSSYPWNGLEVAKKFVEDSIEKKGAHRVALPNTSSNSNGPGPAEDGGGRRWETLVKGASSSLVFDG
ncbi:hypothetical protein QE152_g5681 [Popillia japonica]|uniref:Uncharacterized protein n=1 Tax=Popillia japonica TaxID=7064 RepID=A0AAW1MJU4_POPJA